jgi:hypothetical protein
MVAQSEQCQQLNVVHSPEGGRTVVKTAVWLMRVLTRHRRIQSTAQRRLRCPMRFRRLAHEAVRSTHTSHESVHILEALSMSGKMLLPRLVTSSTKEHGFAARRYSSSDVFSSTDLAVDGSVVNKYTYIITHHCQCFKWIYAVKISLSSEV